MKCTATAKGTGAQCQRDAIRGGTVCPIHGGSAGQVKAAARRRLFQAEAQKTLGDLEIEAVADPLGALRELAGELLALKDWAAAKMAVESDPSAALALYGDMTDRVIRVLEIVARNDRSAREHSDVPDLVNLKAFREELAARRELGPPASEPLPIIDTTATADGDPF